MKTSTTILLVLIALVLGVAALFAVPPDVDSITFNDQGEIFFPAFTDPFICKDLTVTERDPDTGELKEFQVTFRKDSWHIPSHHDYPADAEERMANAATSLIGLRKDQIRSDRIEEHAECGVLDPMESSTADGTGTRITMKDSSGIVIADLIVGKKVKKRGDEKESMTPWSPKDGSDWVYVREPKKKRIYAVNLDPGKEEKPSDDPFAGMNRSRRELLDEISAKFSEWIDTDLLHLERNSLAKLVLHNYSVNEETRRVEGKEVITLEKEDEEAGWTMDGLGEEEKAADGTINQLISALDSAQIEDVSPMLESKNPLYLLSMGFFEDGEGNPLGNEGHMEILCEDGVKYEVFFGEIAFSSSDGDDEEKEGSEEEEEAARAPDRNEKKENRFVRVRVSVDPELEKEPVFETESDEPADEDAGKPEEPGGDGENPTEDGGEPGEEEKAADAEAEKKKEETEKARKEWEEKLKTARERVKELSLRFNSWYYVIGGDCFERLRKDRDDLKEFAPPDVAGIGEQAPEGKEEPRKHYTGFYYIDLADGDGDVAAEGDTVKILRSGWLKDGTQIEAKVDRENPEVLTLEEGALIEGLLTGIKGMKAGAKRKLIIPAEMAFADAGKGDIIPPGATLIFDVELIEVEKK